MSGLAKKVFSLLSIIRGYNIFVLVVALYLSSIFIFSETQAVKQTLLDLHLHYLVFATVCVVASGYIINDFYDKKIDQINRPIKSSLDNYVKQETKLTIYFILNFLGFCFGWLVSWRAALFFSSYIFGIWIYSHKIKKLPILGVILVTILTILPFFSVFIHYKNFSTVIFIHAFFLFFLIMARELIKDLENMKGAIANNYNTFSVAYGERKTKRFIVLLLFLTLIPVVILFKYPAFYYMEYYFYITGLVLVFIGFYLRKANTTNQYRLLHNVLKILLLIGVFSLLFINKSLVFDKVIRF